MDKKNTVIQPYIGAVKRALRGASKWHNSVSPLVTGLAAALWQLDRIIGEMGKLEEITYTEKTAYGEKIVPHPLFGMADKVQNNINRYCKTLGIIPGEIVIEERDDALTELTRDVIAARGSGETIRPD